MDMWCNMIAAQVRWPSDIDDGTPEEVDSSANENLRGGALSSTSVSMALMLLPLLFGAMFM